MREFPKTPPADVPPENHEEAKDLQMQILVLEAQLDSANFENKEAYRRKISQKRDELDSLRE